MTDRQHDTIAYICHARKTVRDYQSFRHTVWYPIARNLTEVGQGVSSTKGSEIHRKVRDR